MPNIRNRQIIKAYHWLCNSGNIITVKRLRDDRTTEVFDIHRDEWQILKAIHGDKVEILIGGSEKCLIQNKD